MARRFIVCQIGAREHYIIPRLLHRAGLLKALVTDVWVAPGSVLQHVPGPLGERLKGRYHSELADARVIHFTSEAIAQEARKKVSHQASRWDRIITHNHWFEGRTLRALSAQSLLDDQEGRTGVLAYSYAARDLIRAARTKGAIAILGQIDGGEADERLISELALSRGARLSPPAPAAYWERWRSECALADRIIVNSDWSKSLLTKDGVDACKLDVVPIAYECDAYAVPPNRSFPASFSRKRPLNVLFLGSAVFRKGILETLEAARLLANRPVAFAIVGSDPDGIARAHGLPNVNYHGVVPRKRVRAFYEQADVFLFPTHSDGFGMTQIEALAAGLPVITSPYCGRVVENGRTGCVLDRVSGEEIASALERFLKNPSLIDEMGKIARTSAAILSSKAETKFLQVVQKMSPEQGRT